MIATSANLSAQPPDVTPMPAPGTGPPPAPSSARATAADPCTCAHCGAPVPAALRGAGPLPSFCCGGCSALWHALHECGLGRYYELRAGTPSPTATEPARRRAELDSAEFLARHAAALADGRLRVEMRLDGLRCGACLWLLSALPRLHPGLLELRVNAGRSIVTIEWLPQRTRLSEIARLLERLGYGLLPLRDRASRERDRAADRAWLARLGVSGALAANAMAVAFALYGGFFNGMEASMRLFFQWVLLGLATVSVVGPGRLFLRNAWLALRSRTPHMDLPIAVALMAALAGGFISTLRGGSGVYGESLAMLIFLLLGGRFLQFRRQQKARHEVDLLTTLIPGSALRLRADHSQAPEEVPVESLVAGDLVVVPAGEAASADGVVRRGAAHADMQTLTGESRPVQVAPGDRFWAGCRPIDGPIVLEVERAGAETRAGQLMALVDEASSRRAPVVAFAERIAGWFLAAVLLLAIGTFAAWAPTDPATALQHAVAMLVVTCPCALGLATPLTMVVSIARAARRGILVKGGDVLERLAKRGTIVFDKTGTITQGKVEVIECIGDPRALQLAAVVEAHSAHPIAAAIVAAAPARGARAEFASEPRVEEYAGRGMRGVVDGREIEIGRPAFVRGAESEPWSGRAQRLRERGLSPVAIAVEGEMASVLGVGDPIRPRAAEMLRSLRERGWEVAMASGDDAAIAVSVGRQVGLEAAEIRGGCTPEEKLALLSADRWRRPLVMVGDGVNDVAAMAAADVGVTLKGGTQAALATADVCIASGDIAALPELLDGARRTMGIIRLNFLVSVAYNLVGAVVAGLGLMNPLLAAILMPISSLTVTTVALRAPRFGARKER